MVSRRSVLLGGASAATVSLAGCLGGSDWGRVLSGGGDSVYTDWVAEPMGDTTLLVVNVQRPGAVAGIDAVSDALDGEDAIGGVFGFDPTDIDRQITVQEPTPFGVAGSVTRVVGSIENVLDEVEQAFGVEFEADDEFGGFEVYSDDEGGILGIDDDGFVYAPIREWFEGGIDASRGEETLLVDEHDAFARVVDQFDQPHELTIQLSNSEDEPLRALGQALEFGDEQLSVRLFAIYETAADASDQEDALVTEFENAGITVESVGTDEEELTIEGTHDIADLGDLFGEPEAQVPQVQFDVDHDAEAQLVTITHDGGDHVPAQELLVDGTGIDSEYLGPVSDLPDSGFDPHDDIQAGDSFDVALQDEAFTLSLVWQSLETGEQSVLLQFEEEA